jgi:peroxiredoxin
MIREVGVALTFVVLCLTVAGQGLRQFDGKLDPNLAPEMFHIYQRVYEPVKDISTYKLDPKPEAGTNFVAGELIDERVSGGKTQVLVGVPKTGAPFVWVDVNRNGSFEPGERAALTATSKTPAYYGVLVLPIANPRYKGYPIYFGYYGKFSDSRFPEGSILIEQSAEAVAYGHADIEGRDVLLQYPFELGQPSISTNEGVFGLDVNGDKRIRYQQFSIESEWVEGEEAVFPVGNTFVSTAKIDMATGAITLREHKKEDYTRVNLEVGQVMPDFDFVDFEGKARKLSDFRGKYLLVDFWGAWCGDCKRETPFHLAAYEKFRKRGFEILGVDSDEKIETAKAYLSQNKMTWPQATNDSTITLQHKQYKLQEYPSTILLGPDGKVLVLDQDSLHGEELLQTLEKVLPK